MAAFIAGNYLDEYAASTQMAVVEIIDEPWMDGDVRRPRHRPLRKAAASPSASLIVYLDVPWPSHITQPGYATGTTLKLHATLRRPMQPLAPGAISPASGPVAGPNTQIAIYVVLNEFHVEWGRVADLDDLDFTDLSGPVNSDEFMGVPRRPIALRRSVIDPILRPHARQPLRLDSRRHAQAEIDHRLHGHLWLERLV